jgi:hypothetical protein
MFSKIIIIMFLNTEVSVNYFSTFVYFLVIHIVQILKLFGEVRPAGGTWASVASIVSSL